MFDGYVRVAVGTPALRVADCRHNAQNVLALMRQAAEEGAKVLALPELCLTGYTCSDLFLQRPLLDGALEALSYLLEQSAGLDLLAAVGLPIAQMSRLYNCAAVIYRGRVLGVVPKRNPPNYAEFYELRHFTPGPEEPRMMELLGEQVPFGSRLLFEAQTLPELRVAVEICEDLWVPDAPGVAHALAGATLILNPSASDETVGKADYRRLLLRSQSARLVCGYLYADAGLGESSTDMVFAAHNLICENGALLAESERYTGRLRMADLDVRYLESERRRMNTFGEVTEGYLRVPFAPELAPLAPLIRPVDPHPFVPGDQAERAQRCEEILEIQARGLAQRLMHTRAKSAVVGVSGGLDSTLALLVTARAFELTELDPQGILAVTMPCFGTTRRTHSNAVKLTGELGASLREVPIGPAVTQHFADISQDPERHDVTYENAQARERTQVLMDLANQVGGLVVGTGDLSELALGWATYNGDHMSMYGVNASVPKTLVRHLVRYVAERAGEGALREVLLDILDTPVSPELLPPVDGEIAQCTEQLVGPYELHDFFLYHVVRRGESPAKIFRQARQAFEGVYDSETVLKWLQNFYRRFFAQQFKRSCLPDGPKVGSVSLSPRGDWRMPSDASAQLWLDELALLRP